MSIECGNCGEVHAARPECLIGVLVDLVDQRTGGKISVEQVHEIDVDAFWDAVGGPAIDWLEEQLTDDDED